MAYHLLIGNFLALFAKQMGMSEALIGALYLFIQAPAVLQIFMARHVDRHGGKRLIMRSFLWSPLTLALLILSPQAGDWVARSTAVPAAGRWTSVACVFLSAVGYVLWNLPVSSAWMPLMRANLPAGRMTGLVGAINRVSMSVALVATLGASLFLGERPPVLHFQILFIVGAVAAGLRGVCFRNVRDLTPDPTASAEPIWRELGVLWADLRFRRLMTFTVIAFTVGGLVGPFRPIFVTSLGFSTRFAAIVSVPLVLGVFGLSSPLWGRLADRYGSRARTFSAASGWRSVTSSWSSPQAIRRSTAR